MSHDDITESFPLEHAFSVTFVPWFADFLNYLACGEMKHDLTSQERKRFLSVSGQYFWEDPYLFKLGKDDVIRGYVPDEEHKKVLESCHQAHCSGHFGGKKTTHKVLQSDFFWPTLFKDSHAYLLACDRCQRVGSISRRNEMHLNNILVVEIFDVWGIDFIGPFPKSFGYEYIL